MAHAGKTLFTSNSGPFVLLKRIGLGLNQIFTQIDRTEVRRKVQGHLWHLMPDRHVGVTTTGRTGRQDRLVHPCCSFTPVNLPLKADLDIDAPLKFCSF